MCDVPNGRRYCPDCRLAVEVFDDHASGDTVCTQCGRVLGQRYVDKSSQWRAILDDVGGIDGRGPLGAAEAVQPDAVTIAYPAPAGNDDTHAAAAAAAAAEGVCSVVGLPRMRGAVGAAGHPRGGAMLKMRRAAPDASHTIADMAERLGLPATVRDHAREVHRKLGDAKAFPKFRKRNALYAACLHVACRAGGTPRTFKELASVTGDNATAAIKDIGRHVKQIKDHLGEEDSGQAAGEMKAVVRAGDFVRRFGSLLGIGDQEVNAALEAAGRLEKNLDVRRNPDSIAAAVIYMAIQRAGAGKSISDVSTVTGVSEVTIREVYHKDLRPHADLLFGKSPF